MSLETKYEQLYRKQEGVVGDAFDAFDEFVELAK